MRADRLIRLLLTLQARGTATAADLAAELEVSVRTVYRDVLALQVAGVPVLTTSGPGGGISLLDGYRTRLTGLRPEEAAVLGLAGVPGAAEQLGVGGALDTARAKLDAAVPDEGRAASARLRERVVVDAPGWFRSADEPAALAELFDAVLAGVRVDLRYRRRDRTVRRTVDPLGLVVKAGTWYLVAGAGRSRRPRTFRVSRVASVRRRDEPARRPDGFDLATMWQELGAGFERDLRRLEVRIRVPAPRARRLRDVLPAATAAAALEDAGPVDADGRREIRFTSESVEVAVHELLGLAPDVEVLEPSAVRRGLAEAGAALAARNG